MADTILLREEGGVLVIALNRPEVMNALNAALRRELTDALRSATARCVVLTGEGRAFCAGQDLGEADAGLEAERILRDEYVPLLHAIRDCPAPVLAAVNGVAAGAGASLALACDVVVASEAASFSMAFTRIGLMPDMGATWGLPRNVGLARAMGLTLFAEPIPARQAADWGLIWEAVPEEAFTARWRERAAALAGGPAGAFRATRLALRQAFETGLDAQLATEERGQAALAAAPDFQEGVAAFRGRRPPRFPD